MIKTIKNKINRTYNDGIAKVLETRIPLDKFNTPLKNKMEYTEIKKVWYRVLGITAEEQYTSRQVDEEVICRIAFPLDKSIHAKYKIVISNTAYAIARVYQNAKNNETELSLKEWLQ